MATQVQFRGGTTAQNNAFTGASKELTVDTDKDVVVVHDGATAGGHPLMAEDGSNSALALGTAGTPALKFIDTNTGIYSPGPDQIALSTGGTGRLFIDSSGRLLVGTSTSVGNSNFLQVYPSSTNNTIAGFFSGTSSGGVSIDGFRARGSKGSESVVSNNDGLLRLRGWGYSGAASDYVYAGSIDFEVDGTPDSGGDTTDMPGRLVFSTTADGESTPTEAMRIDRFQVTRCKFFTSDNYVIVGVEQGGTTVNAAIDRTTNGNGTNAVYIGTSQIQVTSDIRLKHNVTDTELNATEKIKQIEIFDFDWNDPRDNEWKNCRGRWTGFSAQQVQPILPFCINAPRDEETREILEDDPSDWVVDPTGFIPVLVKALQEANAKIETLEQRLSDAGIA